VCLAALQLITYEALGLCGPGEGGKLIDNGDVTYGGKWVVNPSGGLISKGHPLGATGIAQCAELCWQVPLFEFLEFLISLSFSLSPSPSLYHLLIERESSHLS
jgi:hypothetical protein